MMDSFPFRPLAITVALAVYSQLVWKARALAHQSLPDADRLAFIVAMLKDLWTWTAIAATVIGAFTWMLTLRRLDLTVAYAMMAAVFVFVPLGAHLLFREPLPAVRILGLSMIVLGIILAARAA